MVTKIAGCGIADQDLEGPPLRGYAPSTLGASGPARVAVGAQTRIRQASALSSDNMQMTAITFASALLAIGSAAAAGGVESETGKSWTEERAESKVRGEQPENSSAVLPAEVVGRQCAGSSSDKSAPSHSKQDREYGKRQWP